jgi:hypothetical protein
VLVGTTSVEKSELLSTMLAEEGVKHQARAMRACVRACELCVCVCVCVCACACVCV